MDQKLVYAKTPTGDEAVRQRTRVVQRNLRMVLVQVDGKLTVQDLSNKIGNPVLVENALLELEAGGFIAPTAVAMSVWEDASKQVARKPQVSALSQFSTFGSKAPETRAPSLAGNEAGRFSAFGKSQFGETRKEPVMAGGPAQEMHVEQASLPRKQKAPFRISISGKSVFAAVMAVPLLVVLGALVYPYSRHKPALEAALSAVAKSPAIIGDIELSIWPKPQLVLTRVSIGGDLKAEQLRIDRPYQLLGDSPRRLSSVTLVKPEIPVGRLLGLPAFNPNSAPFSGVTVANVRMEAGEFLAAQGLALGDLEGDFKFGGNGRLEKASLQSTDRSLLIEAKPGGSGLELQIEGRAWKPGGGRISFEALQAAAVLERERLSIRDIDTTFLGGLLKGQWRIDWAGVFTMSGEGQLTRLDSRKLAAALAPQLRLEGDFSGSWKLRGSGSDWESVWRNVEATVDMSVTRGLLSGLDLGEAARRRAGATVRGGSTKFDQMRGDLFISANRVTGRNLRMDSGMVTAAGDFSATAGGNVDGRSLVTVQTSVSSVRVPVRISGVLPDLDAASGK